MKTTIRELGRRPRWVGTTLALCVFLLAQGCGKSDTPEAAGPADEAAPSSDVATGEPQVEGERPEVGQTALDFVLASFSGEEVRLHEITQGRPVVLLVMRGWIGKQCPNCTAQFGEFLAAAGDFAAAGAQVAVVYPGPEMDLELHAADFISGQTLPESFTMLLDPGMKFTTAYGLRWDEDVNTAYPATVVIGRNNVVKHVTISPNAGGRTSAAEILATVRE